jgi:hypothetical protein
MNLIEQIDFICNRFLLDINNINNKDLQKIFNMYQLIINDTDIGIDVDLNIDKLKQVIISHFNEKWNKIKRVICYDNQFKITYKTEVWVFLLNDDFPSLNVYEEPSIDSQCIDKININDFFIEIDRVKEWIKIIYYNFNTRDVIVIGYTRYKVPLKNKIQKIFKGINNYDWNININPNFTYNISIVEDEQKDIDFFIDNKYLCIVNQADMINYDIFYRENGAYSNMILELKTDRINIINKFEREQLIISSNVWTTYVEEGFDITECLCCKIRLIKNNNFMIAQVICENEGGNYLDLDNLRPVCGICYYNCKNMNMIEYIKKNNFYLIK